MDADLSGGVVVAIVLVGLAVLALDVYCIVDIVRRHAVLGDHKWIWILVVLFFNLLGPLVYLAIGRTPAPAAGPASPPGDTDPGAKAVAAADLLYGPASPPASARPSQRPAEGSPGPAAPDAPAPPAAPPAPR